MGELARQPGCPEVATTPLELLTPRPGEGFTVSQKIGWTVLGAAIGLATSVSTNIIRKRPLWAGLHRHIALTAGTAYLMNIIRDMKYAASAENDEVYKHYIRLHPCDFPPFERKRYADVYYPFTPIR